MADHRQTAENRREFLARMNAELDAIDSQIDQFRAEFRDESTMGATFGTDDRIDTLNRRRDDIRRRSRELEDFDGDNWETARRDIENARDDLTRSLHQARNNLCH